MTENKFDIDSLRDRSMPFTLPEGYFDRQHEALLGIARQPRPKQRFRLVPMILSAAASLAVAVPLALYLMNPAGGTPDLDTYIASLSDSELNQSIAMDDFDTYSEFIITDEY